jgi:hypothetical protein
MTADVIDLEARRRQARATSPDSPPGSPERPIEMCGCRNPLVGAGFICQHCGRDNLAALLKARPADPHRLPAYAILAIPPDVKVHVI